MKYSIYEKGENNFGDKKFPISLNRVEKICLGTFGDFEYPFYHNVIAACYADEEGIYHHEIIGKFRKSKIKRKFLIFKKQHIVLRDFKTEYSEKEVNKLLKLA